MEFDGCEDSLSFGMRSHWTRFREDARKPMKKAKETASRFPDAIVTDGLPAYPMAIKDVFYGLGRIQNPHIRLKDFETKPNNNIIERLQGTFRERTEGYAQS